MAYIPVSQLNPAELAARREKERNAKRAYRARQKAKREAAQTPMTEWDAAEQEAERLRQEAERERKAAERRAKRAAYQRERRARLKDLSAKERQLLGNARRWGLKNITPRNIKQFVAYLETRTAQHIASFTYEELVEVSKDYDALMEVRRDPNAIMQDFAEYQAEVINALEQVRGALTDTKAAKYSAALFENEWARYVEDVRDEMQYNDRKNKKKRG